MHHKIAMDSIRRNLEKLTEEDTDTDETYQKTNWIGISILAIAIVTIGMTAPVIRKVTKKYKKESEESKQRIQNLERDEKTLKDKVDEIQDRQESLQRVIRDIKRLKWDRTIDHITSMQNGTFKLE